jgi:hypothetical protein
LWHVSKAKKENMGPFNDFFEKRFLLPFYDEEQHLQKQNWDKYFDKYGGPHIPMILDPSLETLYERGTPEHLRSMLWHIASGAVYKWIVRPGYYYELFKDDTEEFNAMIDTIDKVDFHLLLTNIYKQDLHRSFPGHPFFHKKENLEKLRRVLVAYSIKNPAIGYCQSMVHKLNKIANYF